MTNITSTDADTIAIDSAIDVPAHNPDASVRGDTDSPDALQKIYLKDYHPPIFSVDTVYLDIKVYDNHATVDSDIKMQRQHAGELVLYGQDMSLLSIAMNGVVLTESDYTLDDEMLVISDAPQQAVLTISVCHQPQENTALEGLYLAGTGEDAMYVSQCEPEGFRKITYYPDRPDILAIYTTRLEAHKKYPTLLSNGNLLESGDVEGFDDRHYAIWHDPFKKSSYLFACIFADLDVLEDSYTTIEDRQVKLQIYAKSHDIGKCHIAMQALKDAMHWDEVNYGRAYDLDRFMIVAVRQFMGAMENKGLNIFNMALVISNPETATDDTNFFLKSVIAHEYFHNWTGNRITCRDWFQLCLKEGLTVFRDQSFSADFGSPAVQRIENVSGLINYQFGEDAGPLAHPPRPDSFVEISNFYTGTVYEKGAEIARMLANTLGKDKYREGTDTYFERYDGQAVTVEDWLSALSANGVSVEHFLDWYTQPGTPVVSGNQTFDKESKTLSITLSQKTRKVEGYNDPKPLPIPVASAIFDRMSGKLIEERLLMLTEAEQTFEFGGVATQDNAEPVLSLLRDFSAPVQLKYDYSDADLAFLLAHETNGFNQWQSAQTLVNKVLLKGKDSQTYLEAVKTATLKLAGTDGMLAARLLDIPSERELALAFSSDYNPVAVNKTRMTLKTELAMKMAKDWALLYESLPIVAYADTPEASGRRALRNIVLDMALTAGVDDAYDWAQTQYDEARCMTERWGALKAMVNHQHKDKQSVLDDFYNRYSDNDLVIDMWFRVQSSSPHATTQDTLALIEHDKFDWGTPDRVFATIGPFNAQPTKLWTDEWLDNYMEIIIKLDALNPSMASGMISVLSRWYTLVEPLRSSACDRLKSLEPLLVSKPSKETVDGLLKAG